MSDLLPCPTCGGHCKKIHTASGFYYKAVALGAAYQQALVNLGHAISAYRKMGKDAATATAQAAKDLLGYYNLPEAELC